MGIVVQLVEATHHDHDHEWEPPEAEAPAAPENPPPPVSILGVRMRTADRDAALRQWGELLGGEVTESANELVFTWPGSSMRVAVTVEDGAANEALAIELQTDRTPTLPSGPHDKLGTRFIHIDQA